MVAEVEPLLDEAETRALAVFADLLADLLNNGFSALRDVASQGEHEL